MNLKNSYKVLYDAVDGAERVITASTTGTPEGAEEILRVAMGGYKLIYQDAEHKIRGSVTGIPAADDKVFTEFDKVFVEATSNEEAPAPTNVEEPVVEPEVPVTPVVEEPTIDPEEE